MMRYSMVLLLCSLLVACGKTGALYLPEEAPEEVPEAAPQQQPAPATDAEDSGKTD